MSPEQFIALWQNNPLTERAGAQAHFDDLCDRENIVIHTAFTGYPDEPRTIRLEQLVEPETRQILKWVFTDPEKLRPEKSTAAITAHS